ncbi:MAG: hypothetical protein JWL61_5303 [Gemmatimonadetes bacterium]|nr:hypothetical protein [Gemmatimonadota bacterium]
MSATTGIEWTHHTFNIVWGCVRVSPGCEHCYAEGQSKRYGHAVWGPAKTTPRRVLSASYWNEPLRWNAKAAAAGERKRVFCGSMCDWAEDHPTTNAEREKLWPLIRATPWLDWLLLTKRPERIAQLLPEDWGEGYLNVRLGTSVESPEYLKRAYELHAVPSLAYFLSCEPMLASTPLRMFFSGRVRPDWDKWWVIDGGESQAGARPAELEWFRLHRDECAEYGIPYFLKQLGGHPDSRAHERAVLDHLRHVDFPVSPANAWVVYQLADDREVYGDNAGRWIITTADFETEIAGFGIMSEAVARRIVDEHNASLGGVPA